METLETIGEGLTFEKVWAAIQATNEQIRATDEQLKATGEEIKAAIKSVSDQIKETGKQIGKLSKRFGETVEYIVVPNLVTKFQELGFEFERAHRDTEIRGRDRRLIAQIDVFLEDGDRVMIVETKVKPNVDDINDHVKRMEKLRAYADSRNDKRKYLGAIAGVVFGDDEKTYALKRGFYVLEPSGDTFAIIEPTGEYHPHEW